MNNGTPFIDRDVIFQWVKQHMGGEEAHTVFYDEEREVEFEGLDPKAPTEENQFQPFLSMAFVVRMLLAMGVLVDVEG